MKAILVFIRFLPELIAIVNRIISLIEQGITEKEIKEEMKKVDEIVKKNNAIEKASIANKFWNNTH